VETVLTKAVLLDCCRRETARWQCKFRPIRNVLAVVTARCNLVQRDHIGWNSSEIISQLVSVGRSLSADRNIMGLLQGNTRKFWPKVTHPLLIWASETFDRKLRPNGYR